MSALVSPHAIDPRAHEGNHEPPGGDVTLAARPIRAVVGTAGHVDHGKSTLVADLTGIDTDRLAEEKRRGISIELGFAWMDLEAGRVGVIDVPGHERFIRTMISGAAGIDVVVLVVAADDGVMPQTREHLDVCDILGVRHGLVVITKTDLVDSDWLDLVTEEVRETLEGSALRHGAILHRRRGDPSNLETIRQAISDQVLEAERAKGVDDSDRPLKLSVDRVFTIKGFGTVVTGTVQSGVLTEGDDILILPHGTHGRVRGLQQHGEAVRQVRAGTRAAINLQGVAVGDLSRGDVIASSKGLPTTHLIDASFRPLAHLEAAPAHRASMLFHVGSAQVVGTLSWIDDPPSPGQEAMAQLRLEHPIAWLPGEAYVARGFSEATERGRILGGGRLLAPAYRRHRSSDVLRGPRARGLADREPVEGIRGVLAFAGAAGASRAHLVADTPLGGQEIEDGVAALIAAGDATEADGNILLHEALEPVVEKLSACLDAIHAKQPARAGVGADELLTRVRPDLSPGIFAVILERATRQGLIRREGDLYARAGFEAFLSPGQAKACDALREALISGGLSPPRLPDLPEATGLDEDALEEAIKLLVDGGEVIRIARDLVYDAQALASLRERLVSHLQAMGTIDTPTFKDLVGASRKWTIPLFEHFDRERLTVRVGDLRKLR
jgi:selenocysteine-specific elongation factor